MACCVLGAVILSALFRLAAVLRRLIGLAPAPERPDPSTWRPGMATAVALPAPASSVWSPLLVYVAAPAAIMGAVALAYRFNPAAHDALLHAGLSIGIPLSEFVAWCGL